MTVRVRIVTKDRDNGKEGVKIAAITAMEKGSKVNIVTVLLDGETKPAHFPASAVEEI